MFKINIGTLINLELVKAEPYKQESSKIKPENLN